MRQERFTRIRLLVTYLTRCLRAFSHIAQDLGLLTDAPCGGLDSPPARRARRVGSSITGTAGLMVVTFYIPITPLSGHTSLQWFGIPACTANPEGYPPSLIQHGSCWWLLPHPHSPFRTLHQSDAPTYVKGQLLPVGGQLRQDRDEPLEGYPLTSSPWWMANA